MIDLTLLDTRSPVVKIEEVTFATEVPPDKKGWWHCIFRLTLEDGKEYALDLTGIQFGPDWPLLMDWWEYCYKHITTADIEISPFGSKNVNFNMREGMRVLEEVAVEVDRQYEGDDEWDESW